jgi:NADH:ubiquinone oxidoreductase subunit 5 (subunit L)/multisubunit Na+/H+ antiporter MnhA subunit
MNIEFLLPLLFALAWLLPLASFTLIVFFGPQMGRAGNKAAHVATTAIVASFVLSFAALVLWLVRGSHEAVAGDWYLFGEFGSLRVTIGYYIDSLTVAMFCMVTMVASCIHVYSIGYMHGELSDVIDAAAPLRDGQPMRRRGRYFRFFQYLSLFCFSMLGLVVAGNVAMVFMFWELVGICSYLLIGFWRERQSASNAANKAFIVNRVGDFGMIIGLMIIWTGMGTFSFSDYKVDGPDGTTVTMPGIFSQVRPAENEHRLQVPEGMIPLDERREMSRVADTVLQEARKKTDDENARAVAVVREMPDGRESRQVTLHGSPRISVTHKGTAGYWLLVVAGLGIFCGCVGKSAQFPLHVWLPDAMEGPTPVSALIHAATMVAAGVYLVGRFYPVFTPEVLLVIACIGCITLFIAATIAITATDIKRVLAYSTVSQLGFMMLALGLGGWLAGMMHLFTHAFFKSLLFLCSGSVIHACGTNEMPQMGGLRRKMPITAITMLVGCLAIAGAGIPTVIGLSGFKSKDMIIAQDLSFWKHNAGLGGFFFYAALLGAGMTAFYMFRLWYLTFAGNPRDGHVYHHAHESPRVMTAPLMILAVMAICVAWSIPWFGGTHFGLEPLLKQAQPAGIAEGVAGGALLPSLTMPSEELAEVPPNNTIAEWAAFGVALFGFVFATMFYATRKWNAKDVRQAFPRIYRFLVRKWMFDELYAFLFVRPVLCVSGWVANIDKKGLDWLADNLARVVVAISRLDEWIDRIFIDAPVNLTARWTYALGMRLRKIQTGSIRQYVMWIAAGVVGLYVLMSLV